MDELARRYEDRSVRSIFIYTREAHPGENLKYHSSIEQKIQNAQLFKNDLKITRQVLVDSLEGTVHKAFGALPNMSWIIGRGGLVEYRASWTLPEDIEQALAASTQAFEWRKQRHSMLPVFSERRLWQKRDDDSFRRGLERSGPKAVSDFYSPALEKYRDTQEST